MWKETVVIIQSTADTPKVVTNILSSHGYQLLSVVASEGAIISSNPDVMLIELEAWDSSIPILTHLQQKDPYLPIILLTSDEDYSLPLQALRLGVRDYIVKPFQANELLPKLEQVLREKRLRQITKTLRSHIRQIKRQTIHYQQALNTLVSIGKSLPLTGNDTAKFWLQLVEAAVYLTKADQGAMLLFDTPSEQFQAVATVGVDNRLIATIRLNKQQGCIQQLSQHRQALLCSEPHEFPLAMKTVLYAPIMAGATLVGLLQVGLYTAEFENNHLRLLSALGDYGSLYMENLSLQQQAAESEHRLAKILP